MHPLCYGGVGGWCPWTLGLDAGAGRWGWTLGQAPGKAKARHAASQRSASRLGFVPVTVT